MKYALFILAACLALSMVLAIQNRTGGKNVNRPKFDAFGIRTRRSPYGNGVKGGVRVHPLFQITSPSKPMPELRKGEYVCGDKICKLQPGVEPKGCGGICQYPL